MIRTASFIHLSTVAALSAGTWLFGTPQHALSCLFAGLLIGANLGVIAWSISRIFQKKSIALAVSVIVIKYAALLGLLVLLHKLGWQMNVGFMIGLASLFPTVGYVTLNYLRSNEINGSL